MTEQKPNSSLPVTGSKVKKKNLILITIIGFLGLIILSSIAYTFLINQADLKCETKIENLITDVESKNYCNHVDECQIISLPRCSWELAGLDVDTEYVAEVFSEFYSPDGDCWTGLAPECSNPKEEKSIVCENNKCLFKDLPDNYNGNQLTKDCEKYTYHDCPKVCYQYSGPSSCGWDKDFEICTQDLMTGCFSQPYDPHKR